MQGNFRDLVKKVTPWWFRHGIAERFFYALGLVFDGLVDLAIQCLRLRFPGDNMRALPDIAAERRLRQGKYETDEDFAVRLRTWLQAHLDRGGPYALLEQIHAYYRPNNFDVYLYYATGSYFHMAEDGSIAHTIIEGTGAAAWAHWYLVYVWPTGLEDDGLWSDPGLWDDDPLGVWDYGNLTSAEAQDLRLIPQEWNAAHPDGTLILLGPTDALWDLPVEDWDSVDDWDDGVDPGRIAIP